jgi:hypothetical protein
MEQCYTGGGGLAVAQMDYAGWDGWTVRETLNKWLRGRIAALHGARSLAYRLDMPRPLCAARLALHHARRFLQRFLEGLLK